MTGSTKDMFRERGRGLENEFFYRVDVKLQQRLRDKAKSEAGCKQLAQATGITDPAVLNEILESGITPESLVALSLVPLVRVAWADRTVDSREREAALKAARGVGLSEDSASYSLLSTWLQREPSVKLYTTWQHYAKALAQVLPEEQLRRVRDDITQRTRDVAEATGGFLGIGSVSEAEVAVIADVEDTLQPH